MENPLDNSTDRVSCAPSKSHWTAVTLRALLALLAVAVLAGLIYPANLAFKRAESLDRRMHRFEILRLGLQSYHDTFNALPLAVSCNDSGAVRYSWRVTLMPFTEGVKDLLDLDSPWTAPTNRYFAGRAVYQYCNPDERDAKERIAGIVSVIVGDDTPMQLTSSRGLSGVPGDTILLIESKPDAEHWMAPGDLPLSELLTGSLKHDGQGLLVGFADGEIWHLHDSVPSQALARFAIVNPSEPRDRASALGPFKISSRRVRSFE
jgi:Protein of unknown function (DUF1559)